MNSINNPYTLFLANLKLLVSKRPDLIVNTLSNIFTMRLIGNKTHGDMAEIGIAEFINQFMYNYSSVHVGKDLFRKKKKEEDITVVNELTKEDFPVSLKAYGDGPLQLSTDKEGKMFPMLQKYGNCIDDKVTIEKILKSKEFEYFANMNVMPLIYREKKMECSIMVFDSGKAIKETASIVLKETGNGRKHPIYEFKDKEDNYICEVRYGGASANALQRGLWTNTVKASAFFDNITGWIGYQHNKLLVGFFSLALNATPTAHQESKTIMVNDIKNLVAKGNKP